MKALFIPEAYPVVEAIAGDLSCSVKDLMNNDTIRKQIDLSRYISEKVGLPTLNDILDELAKPGRDPRKQFENIKFIEGVEKIEDVNKRHETSRCRYKRYGPSELLSI